MSPLSVVFVPVAAFAVSVPLLIFVIAAVPVAMFTVCAASLASVISGRRRRRSSAAVAASVRGVALRATPVGGRVRVPAAALLQAGRAKGVEEEALVGAAQGALEPGERCEQMENVVLHRWNHL